MSDREYWAAKPVRELGPELMSRVERYAKSYQSSWSTRAEASYHAYYGMSRDGYAHTSSIVGSGGRQGELALVNANHYRNIIQHLLVMATQMRPSFETRAINTDWKSQIQAAFGDDLLEYYMREKGMERQIDLATETGLVLSEAFVRVEWDPRAGREYAVEERVDANGEPYELMLYEGDLRYKTFPGHRVVRDITKEDAGEHEWYITIEYENRYNLAARYPDKADEILALGHKAGKGFFERSNVLAGGGTTETEDVPKCILYHAKTPALPRGRRTMFLSPTLVFDGDLPYQEPQLYRMAPSEQLGTCFGYTVGFDLLGLQELLDALVSIPATNLKAFGVQNVLTAIGSNFRAEALTGDLKVLWWDSTYPKPEALQLTASPPEVFTLIQLIAGWMETLSGVNSVARGNPEQSLKSGAALALVQSMAIQFSSGLQRSRAHLLEDVGTATLRTLRDFAKAPHVAVIAGKNNRGVMKEFTGDKLARVDRVYVDLGNPLSRTIAGRVGMADSFAERGWVNHPRDYMQVVETGRLDTTTDPALRQQLHIQEENERLQEGEPVYVTVGEPHRAHVVSHLSRLQSTEAKEDDEIKARFDAHIMEHVAALMTQDPAQQALLRIIGEEPLTPGGPPQLPPGAQQPQPGNGAGKGGGGGNGAPMLDPTQPIASQLPNMPQGPINPLTGERVQLPQLGG